MRTTKKLNVWLVMSMFLIVLAACSPVRARWAITRLTDNGFDDGGLELINISDITYLVEYLFGIPLGAPPPSCI